MHPNPTSRSPLMIHECPSCKGTLSLRKLVCHSCDLTLEGSFAPRDVSGHVSGHVSGDVASHRPAATNEFASLPDEDLHLLRIFVHCEGSIREMESALGLSYPTIKARLAKLRESLKAAAPAAKLEPVPQPTTPLNSVEKVLDALERGEITASESIQHIRRIRGV